MDRLNQLRPGGGSGRGSDATLDTSLPSEAYMSANESSKYFSLSESFDITPIKDVSLASAASAVEHDHSDPDELMSNLSPITKKDVMLDSYKIGKQIEAANILSGGVDIFDNDNSYDGDELVIDDNVNMDDKLELDKEAHLEESDAALIGTPGPVEVASKDTEVVLQIDGKNVDAIDIGNGLYLYRKTGQEELAAVQIITENDQAPTFKFLKVRENAEGNLEVYEEFEIEVSKDMPVNEAKPSKKNTPHVPVKDMNKSTSGSSSNKVPEIKDNTPPKDISPTVNVDKDIKEPESKTELNLNGKMMKFNESRKSPVVGTFTPMTYHSTPNKEGKPLTKTMVDQQLHPSRHSDNVKKTIEVHTESQTKKVTDETSKHKSETNLETSTDVVDCTKSISDNIVSEPKVKVIDQIIESNITTGNVPKIASATKDLLPSNKNKQEAVVPMRESKPINEVSSTSLDQTQKIQPNKIQNKAEPASIPATETTYEIPSKPKDTDKKDVSSTSKTILPKEMLMKEKPFDAENSTNLTNMKPEIDSTIPVIKSNVSKLSGNHTNKLETKQEIPGTRTLEASVAESCATASKVVMETEKLTQPPNKTDKTDIKSESNLIIKGKESIITELSEINTKVLETKQEKPKLQDTEKKDVNVVESNFTDIKVAVEAEKPIQAAKITEQTEMNPEGYSIVPENQTNVAKNPEIVNSLLSDPEKSKSVPNVKSIKPSVSKEMDPKIIPQTKKPNPVSKQEPTKVLSNEIHKIKAVEPSSISKTEKNKVILVKSTASTTAQLTVFKNKTEAKALQPQINRFLPVAKVIDPKIGSKSSILIGHKPILPNDKMPPVTKQIEPVKVYSKTDKMISTSKCVEAKAMSSYYQVNPITKGIELKTFSKPVMLNPAPNTSESMVSHVEKPTAVASQIPKSNAVIITSNKIIVPSKTELKKLGNYKEINVPTVSTNSEPKSIPIISINNNHSAVPFGKWTEANRQEFLNKFKDIKPPTTSNTKQIKNSNDLNRIDVLKKIDSQRSNNASIKIQDKSNVKDTVFSTKIAPPTVESKIPVKNELKVKTKPVDVTKPESVTDTVSSSSNATSDVANPGPEERREVNVNDLIGKAIVDMLNRPVPLPMTRSPLDEPRQVDIKDNHILQAETNTVQQKNNNVQQKTNADVPKIIHVQKLNTDQAKNIDLQKKIVQDNLNTNKQQVNTDQKNAKDENKSLDEIEMKMNKLHGIPFVERPPHELPKVHKTYNKSSKESTQNKTSNKMLPTTSKHNDKGNIIDIESDDEVIEHEPITGDIDLNLKTTPINPSVSSKAGSEEPSKKEPVITENDFDKFVRRNSKSYENCLTVNYDGKESTNVVQTVKEKHSGGHSRNEVIKLEHKTNMAHKNTTSQIHAKKISITKFGAVPVDAGNKNYQSKIHSAYQSALTAKLQMDRPISIIEDKPVKVVFMDANAEFVPNQLNVQGKELSPAKTAFVEPSKVSPPPNSNVTDAPDDKHDDTKVKTKHQRKQILNPVKSPELELIQPGDLGFDESPKKKRKTDFVHKKSYLLGRAVPDDKLTLEDVNPSKETMNRAQIVSERVTSAVSAIDNLVKAAELLENQSVQCASPNPDSQQGTPIKRGRGRPRKYPLPEEATDYKAASPSPQKKPRLIDAKPIKPASIVSDGESSDEGQMVLENWTMGKINENIVCPICNKLFRSENVVFKHVKHCTGVSPTRSDLEKRRRRHSGESDKSFDSHSEDMEFEGKSKEKNTPKKLKSTDMVDIIVIEDTPLKDQKPQEPEKKVIDEKAKPVTEPVNIITEEREETRVSEENEKTLKQIADEKRMLEEQQKLTATKKEDETPDDKSIKKKVNKALQRPSDHICEFCGKTFRQLSYLVNHKLQHKKEQQKKLEAKLTAKLQVYICEVCKKQFRKLHHLVQHRIIHNPDVPARTRKSSPEQSDMKAKEHKPNEDTSAGFRCEPCDKSFRKLHHLVEHRETHDGINRQKSNLQTAAPIEKPSPPPHCEICKKSFRKLHHLIEHKEQHHAEQIDTSSEKSDDKSVQSSLSTRDIIHECSLCYMVFPNEHSLNKHFVNCQQKKKRQSKPKNKIDDIDTVEESTVDSLDIDEGALQTITEEVKKDDVKAGDQETETIVPDEVEKPSESPVETKEKSSTPMDVQNIDVVNVMLTKEKEITLPNSAPIKRDLPKPENGPDSKVVPEKIQKLNEKPEKESPKKISLKNKVAPSMIKRKRLSKQKNVNSLPDLPQGKPAESSDDDEVRYMLNPNLVDETTKGKVFMQVRSNKRSSLQFEPHNFENLMNRKTSLQHPPKIPRLKAKAVEPKVVPTETKNVPKPKTHAKESSTDSDDSDVKYCFSEKMVSKLVTEAPKEKKVLRKSLSEKRKSLGGIAKRKSLGQTLAKHKPNPPLPVRIIKKRSLDVEHRCDCGQLFSSAALLTRHTSLAHTPPRIRKRRSPPPEVAKPAVPKPAQTQPAKTARKSSAKPEADTHQPRTTRKSSVKAEPENKPIRKSSVKAEPENKPIRKSSVKAEPENKPIRKSSVKAEPENKPIRKSSVKAEPENRPTRKSSVKPGPSAQAKTRKSMAKPDSSQSEVKVTPKTRKSIKLEGETKSMTKLKVNAHRGVPVPEKMLKLMMNARRSKCSDSD